MHSVQKGRRIYISKNKQYFETVSGVEPYLKSSDKNKYLNIAAGTRSFRCILAVMVHLCIARI
jgi:hypothetical protein